MNAKELTHSQQQPQASNAHKKEANNQTDYHSHNVLGARKVPSLQALGFG